jgi:hypothetical protein
VTNDGAADDPDVLDDEEVVGDDVALGYMFERLCRQLGRQPTEQMINRFVHHVGLPRRWIKGRAGIISPHTGHVSIHLYECRRNGFA